MNFTTDSALIISDNFILSLTLNGILKKNDGLAVYEAQGFNSTKNILVNEHPEIVFIDTDIKSSSLQKLHSLLSEKSDAHLCYISHPENIEAFRNQIHFDEYRTHIISKPFDQDDIKEVLNTREMVLA